MATSNEVPVEINQSRVCNTENSVSFRDADSSAGIAGRPEPSRPRRRRADTSRGPEGARRRGGARPENRRLCREGSSAASRARRPLARGNATLAADREPARMTVNGLAGRPVAANSRGSLRRHI